MERALNCSLEYAPNAPRTSSHHIGSGDANVLECVGTNLKHPDVILFIIWNR